MKIIGRCKVHQKGLSARLNNWLAEISHAHWKIPSEVQSHFPSVEHIDSNKFIYPVTDKKMAVEFLIHFPQGIVLITNIIIN